MLVRIYRNALKERIERMGRYLDVIDAHLEQEKSRREPEGPQEWFDGPPDNYLEWEEYQDVLHASFFVALYSFFEAEVVRFCSFLKSDRRIKISFQEFENANKDQGKKWLQLVKEYVNKEGKVSFNFGVPSWEAITKYKQLRNCLVHRQGRVLKRAQQPDEKLRSFAQKNGLLISEESDYQCLTSSFCRQAAANVSTLLDDLYGSI